MMNVQCDKNNFYRYVVSRGNLDLLLNDLGDLIQNTVEEDLRHCFLLCLLLLYMSKPRGEQCLL